MIFYCRQYVTRRRVAESVLTAQDWAWRKVVNTAQRRGRALALPATGPSKRALLRRKRFSCHRSFHSSLSVLRSSI
jgi:hypothetical protein